MRVWEWGVSIAFGFGFVGRRGGVIQALEVLHWCWW